MNKKNFLFLVSPNVGILDSWGLILQELSNQQSEIDIIIPNFSVLFDQFNDSFTPCKILKKSFNNVYFFSPSGNLYKLKKLDKFDNHFIKSLPAFFRNKIFTFLKKKYFYFFENLILGFKPNEVSRINISDFIKLTNKNCNGILYDVLEEHKKVNNILNHLSVKRISFETGNNFHTYNGKINSNAPNKLRLNYMSNSYGLSAKKNELPKINDLTCLLISDFNKNYYKNLYQVKDKNIKVIGIVRHNPIWRNAILSNSNEFTIFNKNEYIFIISRPAQEYFLPVERKIQSIKHIKRITDKLGLKIVIRLHPKENADYGKQFYLKIFGKKSYRKKWIFSNENMLQIAKNSKFTISFFSSTCLDLLMLNTPTIEILDITKIPEEDNEFSLRDENKYPVLPFRYFKFCIGVSNYLELEKISYNIVHNNENYIPKLLSSYHKFIKPGLNIEEIASYIKSI